MNLCKPDLFLLDTSVIFEKIYSKRENFSTDLKLKLDQIWLYKTVSNQDLNIPDSTADPISTSYMETNL